jgi:20S proteasome alpha/beta subunit
MSKKVMPISNHVVATCAGGAADTSSFLKSLSAELAIISKTHYQLLPVVSVAKLLSKMIRNYDDQGVVN